MHKESGEGRESALQSGWTVEARADQADQVVEASSMTGNAGVVRGGGAIPETSEQVPPGEAAEAHSIDSETPDQPTQMSNLTVVMLGLAGGIFMLYAWVWMSWAQYYSVVNTAVVEGSGSIGGVLQQIVYWIAPLAPILWFVSALLLHRRDAKKLSLALVIGLIVLLPLPMIFLNGAAL